MSQGILHRSFLPVLLCLVCVSCAPPALTSRAIQQDSSSFVRLDSYRDAASSSVRYEHPAIWTEEELDAILGRLLLEDRVGLMDKTRAPRTVFSEADIAFLSPAIRKSFRLATPSEWIVFGLLRTEDTGYAVTSGGMFLEKDKLHIVLANHKTAVANNSEELSRVRANPLFSIRGSGGALAFESSRFVTDVQANWSGGNKSSASELILDYQSFLAMLKRTAVSSASPRATEPSAIAVAPVPVVSPTQSQNASDADLRQTIRRLEDEVGQLKKKVEDQEAEIGRLKRSRSLSSPAPSSP